MIPLLPLLPVLALLAAGCTTQATRAADGPVPPAGAERTAAPAGASIEGASAVAPVLSVERFLQAVNARDFDAMASLFGTRKGPLSRESNIDPVDLELQMSILAELLRHQDYRIASERRAPGHAFPTNRIGVDLTIGGRVISDVPFLVVQTESGQWMVNEIDTEKVAGR